MALEKDTVTERIAHDARLRSLQDTNKLEDLFEQEEADTYTVSHETLNHFRGTLYRLEHAVRLLEYKLENQRHLINTMEDIYQEEKRNS